MCGLAAIAGSARPASVDALLRGLRALNHRGPDGTGHWVSPDQRVALGHTRLSIIDLKTGAQPLSNERGDIHAIVNGEFYDFERIREELVARGHRFATRSDSEILLHLYEDHGVHCLSHLRGEFAFILWDSRNQQLFVARDRFGIKPLFYTEHGGGLMFASEAKALFAMGVTARWDHDSVYQEMHLTHDAGRSLFQGVRQVEPGTFLLAGTGGVRTQRYWDYNFPLKSASRETRTQQDCVEQLRATLLDATRMRLRADVPVGVYLSGGLDSCALLGVAASMRSDPIEAFTIAFEEGEYDELPVAEEAARRVGANLHAYRMTEEVLADHFSNAIWQSETFSMNINHTAKYLLSSKVREHGLKVVLTGEGSDENFGGYPFFRRDMMLYGVEDEGMQMRQARVAEMVEKNPIWAGMLKTQEHNLPLDAVSRAFGYVPTWFDVNAARGFRNREILRTDFLSTFADRDPYQYALDRLDLPGQLQGRAPLDIALYIWGRMQFPNKLLNFLGDRSEMAHSVEGRVPFLDHVLVEQAAQMPPEVKINGMTEKWVLREAAKPFLTETVYKRQKHPFMGPPQWKGRMLELVGDILTSRVLDEQPFFDASKVRNSFAHLDAIEGRAERDQAFMRLMGPVSAVILHQRYAL